MTKSSTLPHGRAFNDVPNELHQPGFTGVPEETGPGRESVAIVPARDCRCGHWLECRERAGNVTRRPGKSPYRERKDEPIHATLNWTELAMPRYMHAA